MLCKAKKKNSCKTNCFKARGKSIFVFENFVNNTPVIFIVNTILEINNQFYVTCFWNFSPFIYF